MGNPKATNAKKGLTLAELRERLIRVEHDTQSNKGRRPPTKRAAQKRPQRPPRAPTAKPSCATDVKEIDFSLYSGSNIDSAFVVQQLACLPCGSKFFESATAATELDSSITSRSSNGSLPWSSPMGKAIFQPQQGTKKAAVGNERRHKDFNTRNKAPRKRRQRKQQNLLSTAQLPLQPPEECRFFRSKKGCLNANCPYLHSAVDPKLWLDTP